MSLQTTPKSIQSIVETANNHRALKVAVTSYENLDSLENRFVITGFNDAFKIIFSYKVGGKLVTNMNTATSKASCELNVKLECEIDQEMIGATLASVAGDDEHRIKQATRFMDTLGAFMLHISHHNISPEDQSVRTALASLIDATGHVCDAIETGARHLLPMNVSSAAHKAITHKKFQTSGVARSDNIVDYVTPAAALKPQPAPQARNPFDDLIDFGAKPAPKPFANTLPVIFNPYD